MKISAFVVFILLFSIKSNSQDSYKKSYYINPEKDTITGYIKDYNWKKNPEEIFFKKSLSTEKKILKPEDIRYFEIHDEVKYKSVTVKMDMSENSVSELSRNRQPEFEEKKLFLKLLEDGSAKLYKYEDGIFVRYFFETSETPLQQLIYKKYIYNSISIGVNAYFKQQLLNTLECKSLTKSDFKNLKYNERSLRKIVSDYNLCSGNSEYSYNNDNYYPSFHLSLKPGIQFASLNTEEGINNRLGTDFNQETSFRLGLEIEVNMPYNNKKWSLILEPTYQSYSTRVDYIADGFFELSREVDYTSIEIPFLIRYYSFLNSNNQLFINAGLAYDLGIGADEIIGPRGQRLELSASFNPVFGFGYRFLSKFSFEFRYQMGRNLFEEFTNKKANYKSTSLILGYRFF